MKKKRAAKRESGRAVQEAVKLDTLERINLNAAGLDIGAEEIYACVPDGRDAEASVRVYGTYTTDLYALADWLARCQVDTVAMESTGVYWIPVFEILEARGYKVYLVNARQSKNVSGRKTDVLDCQWIQQLHTYGLLSNSFRPEGEICALRAYLRHRDNLIRYRSGHIQHMQKALQLMNVQLTQAVSDVTGATGMRIIRAIVTGERDPQALARHRDPRCAKSAEEIAQAFIGPHFDVAVECSAFGGRIRWPGEGQPEDVIISPVVESPQDVEDLEVPNACLDGLFPADLDSYRLMRKELADRGLDIPIWMGYGIRGPFILAAMLSGGLPAGVFNESSMKRLLDWVNNQPEVAHELIDKCTQTIAAYIGALWKFMGIEQEIMLCDDFSCYLTPEQFEEFSAPYLARIYKKLDHPLNVYHNCHQTNHLVELIPETQAKVFHLGPQEMCGLAKAKRLIGKRTCLMGNSDPDTTMLYGSPEAVEADAKRCIGTAAEGGGFILAEASGVRRRTPDENVYAVIDAAEKYGKYPIRL